MNPADNGDHWEKNLADAERELAQIRAAEEDAARVAAESVRPDPARAAEYTADMKAEKQAAEEREAAQRGRLSQLHERPNDPIFREARAGVIQSQIIAEAAHDPRDEPLPYGQDHLLSTKQIQFLNEQKGQPAPTEPPTAEEENPVSKITTGTAGPDAQPDPKKL